MASITCNAFGMLTVDVATSLIQDQRKCLYVCFYRLEIVVLYAQCRKTTNGQQFTRCLTPRELLSICGISDIEIHVNLGANIFEPPAISIRIPSLKHPANI